MTDPIAQVEAVLADTTGGRDIVVALAVMPEALAVVRAAEAYREAEDARRAYGDHEGEWTLAVKRTRVALDAALSAFTERVQSALGEEGS